MVHTKVATRSQLSHGGAGDSVVGKSKALAKNPDYSSLNVFHQLNDLGLLWASAYPYVNGDNHRVGVRIKCSSDV